MVDGALLPSWAAFVAAVAYVWYAVNAMCRRLGRMKRAMGSPSGPLICALALALATQAGPCCAARRARLPACAGGRRSFTQQLRGRLQKWHSGRVPWQSLVNDKLFGAAFAEAYGVATPDLVGIFAGTSAPAGAAPPGAHTVVKPLTGHSSRGMSLLRNGTFDILKGREVTWKQVQAKLVKSWDKMRTKPADRWTIVERMVMPVGGERELYKRGPAEDLKFFTLGDGEVRFVLFIEKQTGGRECKRPFSSEWELLKDVFRNVEKHGVGCEKAPEPRGYDQLLSTAQKLSRALGVFYRVDLFNSPEGPVLGEFTPWPNNGYEIYTSEFDCSIGKAWRGVEGANDAAKQAAQMPKVLANWTALNISERAGVLMRLQEQRRAAQGGNG